MSNNPRGRTASTSDARKRLEEKQAAEARAKQPHIVIHSMDMAGHAGLGIQPRSRDIGHNGHVWPCPRFYRHEDQKACICKPVPVPVNG